jgi:capsular polysaccharide export protein
VPAAALAAVPHLAAFWPGFALLPVAPGTPLDAAPAGAGTAPLRWTPGPFLPPSFGGRMVPPLLVIAAAEDPVGAALAAPPVPADRAAVRDAMARIVAGRLGAPPGLADPGGAALGWPPRSARLVIDPCDPAEAEAARARLAMARMAGGPLLLARDPFRDGPPVLQEGLPRLDPWSLLDAAASLHGGCRALALLALAAGVAIADGPLAGADPVASWAALLAATRAADPFRGTPCGIAEALDLLVLWRQREAEARGIAACLGVHPYKRDRVAALLASAGRPPRFHARATAAIAAARAGGGALAAWSASAPPDLAAHCAAAGVRLLWLEDGFIRSAGLGAAFRPGASFALDAGGPHFDPARQSDLARLIEAGGFDAALLARAAALRRAIVAGGVTKYNLGGVMPAIAAPAGRQVILVPGQVEDDASVRLGGGAIRRNIDLLRAVRRAAPDAFLLYKPHPDIEAGFRRGRIPRRALAGLADQVLEGVPMAPLLARVDAVHTLTSLTGFEALLRGLKVTCWGTPFYAGWGLTEDQAPLPPGAPPRRRRATLDELVAAALILYPRCIDPVTLLPCPPELLLERMNRPGLFPPGRFATLRAAEGWLRRRVAGFWGWR